jgi:hypothetical protein
VLLFFLAQELCVAREWGGESCHCLSRWEGTGGRSLNSFYVAWESDLNNPYLYLLNVATTPLVTWTPLPGNLVKHSWHKSPKAWRTKTLQSVCPMSDGYRVTIVCMYCETLAFLKLQNSGWLSLRFLLSHTNPRFGYKNLTEYPTKHSQRLLRLAVWSILN